MQESFISMVVRTHVSYSESPGFDSRRGNYLYEMRVGILRYTHDHFLLQRRRHHHPMRHLITMQLKSGHKERAREREWND